MKLKTFLLTAFVITVLISKAQTNGSEGVSIAPNVTPPHPSAMLEVDATNKGLLIPRVALTSTTDATTITSPATSLLVYNTNTASDVSPNFYYWNGTKWVLLGSTNKVPKVTYNQMQSMKANLTLDDLGLSVFVTDRGFISNVLQDDEIITYCTAEVYGLWYLSSIECTNGDILFWRRISTNQGTPDPDATTACAVDGNEPTLCDPVVE